VTQVRWNSTISASLLADVDSGGQGGYSKYLPERRKMMQDWANYLDLLRERAKREILA
jgi:hypothetical protein